MYYEAGDFLETADNDTLKRIARIRELTREYYFSDYEIGIVTSKTREEFAHDFASLVSAIILKQSYVRKMRELILLWQYGAVIAST